VRVTSASRTFIAQHSRKFSAFVAVFAQHSCACDCRVVLHIARHFLEVFGVTAALCLRCGSGQEREDSSRRETTTYSPSSGIAAAAAVAAAAARC
jgi:hypothetical protein